MAYINFKEERFTALKQLTKRKSNNQKLINELMKKRQSSTIGTIDEKYSFKEIAERKFNGSNMKNEDEFLEISSKNIVCAIFRRCKFDNVKFKDCSFIGCTFEECTFEGGGTIFENCTFIKEDSDEVPSLNKKDNLSCFFNKCNMYVKFLNSNISYCIFEECNIYDTSFELTDMTSLIIINSDLLRINMIDLDLSGAKIVHTTIEDLEFNDKWKSKLDEKSFIDKIPVRKRSKNQYEGLYMQYETFANKFNENNLKNNFGEYYYQCKVAQRKTLKPIPKICSYIYWIASGYGERIIHPVLASIGIIFIFGALYLLFGMEIEGDKIIRLIDGIGSPNGFSEMGKIYNEALILSVGMFAGVGTVNSMPIDCSYMLSNIEMLLGVVMMGIGIGTIVRKLVR
ncbi:pentapeptide repeat-containing protein [Clostridium paraputrificum]|uniref:pentapeptide repeat-containing protein n=1 Tax=Clostridium TaxID=1485 RepID=UPI003D354145